MCLRGISGRLSFGERPGLNRWKQGRTVVVTGLVGLRCRFGAGLVYWHWCLFQLIGITLVDFLCESREGWCVGCLCLVAQGFRSPFLVYGCYLTRIYLCF